MYGFVDLCRLSHYCVLLKAFFFSNSRRAFGVCARFSFPCYRDQSQIADSKYRIQRLGSDSDVSSARRRQAPPGGTEGIRGIAQINLGTVGSDGLEGGIGLLAKIGSGGTDRHPASCILSFPTAGFVMSAVLVMPMGLCLYVLGADFYAFLF